MNIFTSCLFILLVTFLIGLGFYSCSPTGIAEAKVLDLMNQLHQAEQIKIKEKLKQIFADEISGPATKMKDRYERQTIENISNAEFEIESTEATFVFTTVESDKVKILFLCGKNLFRQTEATVEHHADYNIHL